MTICQCFFCVAGKEHPASHTEKYEISSRLLKAESLDPNHLVKRFACETCGHVTEEAK